MCGTGAPPLLSVTICHWRLIGAGAPKLSKVKTVQAKTSLLLQLRAGGHGLGEFHSAEYVLLQSGGRVLNALVEYLSREESNGQ